MILTGFYKYENYKHNPIKFGRVPIEFNILEDLCYNGRCS